MRRHEKMNKTVLPCSLRHGSLPGRGSALRSHGCQGAQGLAELIQPVRAPEQGSVFHNLTSEGAHGH